jgi:hypothetical protein
MFVHVPPFTEISYLLIVPFAVTGVAQLSVTLESPGVAVRLFGIVGPTGPIQPTISLTVGAPM